MVTLTRDYEARKLKRSSSKDGEDTDETGSSLAEPVYIETGSGSDSDALDKEDGVTYQGLHRKNSHSAHGVILRCFSVSRVKFQ